MRARLGFVGVGFIAQVAHIPSFLRSSSFDCVAVADPRADLRQAVARRYSIPLQFGNHLQMLRSGSVDAVVITLPRKLTARVVETCLQHNVWVFTEKPLFLNARSAEKILASVGEKGVCVGFMKRSDPVVINAGKIFGEQGHVFGTLLSVVATCHAGDSYVGISGDIKSVQEAVPVSESEGLPVSLPDALHFDYEQFLNTFSHTLNLSEFLTGRVVRLQTGVLGPHGAGSFIGRIDGVPYALSVSRGKKHVWVETVTLRYEKSIATVSVPAAFDKSANASMHFTNSVEVEPFEVPVVDGRWAFDAQPDRFSELIEGMISPIDDILASWRYAEDAEKIFSTHYVNE
jgi:hypothetical protein